MGNSKSQPQCSYSTSESQESKRQKFSRPSSRTSIGGIYPHTDRSHSATSRQSSSSGIYPHHSLYHEHPPIKFHQVHGENIRLTDNGRVATRIHSFCYAIAFSSRPVRVEEKVHFKLKKVGGGWSGVLRFGFTSIDPARHHPSNLPRYVCPDLTNQPGYWAKAIPENFATQDTVLSFYVNTEGHVFYAINDELQGTIFNGVDVNRPLWFIVDIYGNTTSIEIPCETSNSMNRQSSIFDQLPEASQLSAQPRRSIISLPSNMELEVRQHLCITDPITRIGFSATMGPQLRCRNRKLATMQDGILESGLAFTNTALKAGQTVYMYCAEKRVNTSLMERDFAIGVTTCDPSTIHVSELPFDSAMLLDRPEYWIIFKEIEPPDEKEYFALTIDRGGYLTYNRQNKPDKVTLFHMDISQPLYLVIELCPQASSIALIGMSTEPEPMEYFDIPHIQMDSHTDGFHTPLPDDDIIASLNTLDTESLSNSTRRFGPNPSMPDLYGAAARPSLHVTHSLGVIGSAVGNPGDEQPVDSSQLSEAVHAHDGEGSLRAQNSEETVERVTDMADEGSDTQTVQVAEAAGPAEGGGMSMGEIASLSAPLMLGALTWLGRRVVSRLHRTDDGQESDVSEPEAGEIVNLDTSSSSSETGAVARDDDNFFNAREGTDSNDSSSDDDDDLNRDFEINSRLLDMLNNDLTELLRPLELMDHTSELREAAAGPSQAANTASAEPEKMENKEQEMEQAKGDSETSKECVVCYDSNVNSVIYTCGHACMCYDCGQAILKQRRPTCPICRARVKDVIRMYHA